MFSVVIPLYNKEYSIESCIKSVISQVLLPSEIIVINDGSTDNSCAIVEKFFFKEIESGFIKLVTQENKGVSAARNAGVKIAQSDLICFLDADDEWADDFLESILLLTDRFPDAGVYCLQHQTKKLNFVGANQSSYPVGYIGLVDNFFKRSLKGSLLNSSKICVKKEAIFNVGGFPDGKKSGEDLIVWIKLAKLYSIAFYNKICVTVNVLQDNSRSGRDITVPYPLEYYSDSGKRKGLGMWGRIYLMKVYLAHLLDSLVSKNYQGYKLRLSVGKKIFPVASFFLGFLLFPLYLMKSNEKTN